MHTTAPKKMKIQTINAAKVPRTLPVPERGFISSAPAETWEQGLISGNGTIGASVLSHPTEEIVVFSHKRMLVPERAPVLPPLTATRLFEIRRLVERGLYQQADQLAIEVSDQKDFLYPDPLMPAFDLRIKMEAKGDVTDYMRSTNFKTGETTVHWADSRGVFERRLFVSRADGIAVLLITGPGRGMVNCRLSLQPREPGNKRFKANITNVAMTSDPAHLTYRNGFVKAYPGSVQGCEGVARIGARNGTTMGDGQTLTVTSADDVLIIIDIRMLDDFEKSMIREMKTCLAGIPADYKILLDRHVRIHGELFARMRLDLGGGSDHQLTSEQLLAKTTDAEPSRALIEKVFDAGRYNIISSTNDLPPTLQGVWAGTYDPPWASDFTHNGNVPSAIASMLMGNTPELMLAYTSYMEWLVPYLEINAQRIFGARGIVLPSRSTTDGYNNSFCLSFPGQFWVAGAAWAAHFFYDYYLYTGDRAFLAGHALPFMEKAALFFEDYLYEGPDGRYIFNPTQSPENHPKNSRTQTTLNATMDVAAAKELLINTIAASRELKLNKDRIPVWEKMLAKMPDYMINADGAIKEWLSPELEDNYDHRHSSQLYALYDGMPEEIAKSLKLQAAFKRLIELKLDRHWTNWQKNGGFMSFGLVQLGQAATSLGDADMAYRALVPLINRYWYHSLASTHNAGRLFNMDISGGMPSVLIKMLVASNPGEIRLLPAVPAAWPSGSIEGVLCRGQIEITRLHWTDHIIQAVLKSSKKQDITLHAPAAIKTLAVRQGKVQVRAAKDPMCRRVSLAAGQKIHIELQLVSPVERRKSSATLPRCLFTAFCIFALAAQGMAENIFDFGSAIRGCNYSNTFLITNQYAADLRITQIRPLCSCVKVASYDPVISPGGTGRVTLLLETAKLQMGAVRYPSMVHMTTNLVALPVMAAGGTVMNPATHSPAPTRHQEIRQLEMRITLLDDVTIVPVMHNFGNVAANKRIPPFQVEVYSRTSRDISDLSVATMPPWLCAKAIPSVEGNMRGVTSRWTILFPCTTVPPVGSINIFAPFSVALKNHEGQTMPTNSQYTIQIKGTVDPVFSLQPSLVVLTEVSVSNGAEQTVTLSSSIGAPLYITGVKSSGTAVTIGAFNTNDPRNVSAVLRIKPSCVGLIDETVTFSTAHEAQREITVRVLGNGR